MYAVVGNDDVDIVGFAHRRGVPFFYGFMSYAARFKRWECFKYELRHGCPCPSLVTWILARKCLPALQDLRAHGYGVNMTDGMQSAALVGYVDTMRYLRGDGANWPVNALHSLAKSCSVAALEFAYEDGLPFDDPDTYCCD